MKHLYNFYIELNNIENIDFIIDLEQLFEIDKELEDFLNIIKQDINEDFIDEMTDKIYEHFFQKD